MTDTASRRIPVSNDAQLAQAILETRLAAQRCGLGIAQTARLATAVSELARNVLKYAGKGELLVRVVEDDRRRGVEAQVRDRGPGIENLDDALSDHFSTGGTLGLGLPGVKRMVDDFAIHSTLGEGTRVTVCMWKQ